MKHFQILWSLQLTLQDPQDHQCMFPTHSQPRPPISFGGSHASWLGASLSHHHPQHQPKLHNIGRNLVGTRMQHTLGCAKNPIVAASDKLLQISSTPHHRNSESRELILCRARIKIFTFWPCRPGLFRRGSVWGCGCWPAGLAGPPPRCKADLLLGCSALACWPGGPCLPAARLDPLHGCSA